MKFSLNRRFGVFRLSFGLNIPLLTTAAALCLALPGAGQDATVPAGAGSYTTTRPAPIEALPERIYRTDQVQGPTPTNQWWSSLVWEPHSLPMFAHPLAMRCDKDGLVVAYPGATITANAHGIFGSGDLNRGDLRIGHDQMDAFPTADCGGYSAWFVSAVFHEGDAKLTTTFGHGSPYVYGMIEGGNPCIRLPKAPIVWAGGEGESVIGLTSNGHHYGLFGPTGSRWTGTDTDRFVNHSGKPYFSVAVLPDNRPETLARFAKHAHAHVTGTRVERRVEAGMVEADYIFEITPREGDDASTIFALYPHQWKYCTTELTEERYRSVRGDMKIGEGDRFTTKLPVQGVLPMLPAQGITDRARMLDYLQAEADKAKADFADTYWEGKHLGVLTSLSGVAQAAGSAEIQALFIDELKRRLEAWFTAEPGQDQPVFYYDQAWGAMIGSRPSYGSDKDLNDHHFHYGYFIRAAAEIARHDPAWAQQWGPMVELLIRDIASPDSDDPMFPALRSFDLYAGHSWASGHAKFGDGNNQESSSESLNAWYALMLWGSATDNDELRDLGAFLFNTERTAVEQYWFDVDDTNYPDSFPEVALGMVWGGKGAFATWFSGDIDCIHGINWLPFTPASLYMGRHPDYVKRNYDRIVQRRESGTDFSTGWGDLVVMFGALNDPATAAAYMDANPQCKIEGGNSRPFMYHWIQTLNTLGHVDATVTADHLFAIVFVKDGTKTYAAYNDADQPITVTFSDGKQLRVEPGVLAVD